MTQMTIEYHHWRASGAYALIRHTLKFEAFAADDAQPCNYSYWIVPGATTD